MPNFEPSSIIHIGRVPFDNSYRHTLTFPDGESQAQYFASVCTTSLSKDDYTYVRANNAIRVEFNAETLYTYNYVMYKNANYGSKWFYAFIVGVNYVNSKTTELVLELDVMQTWYFDYQLAECFVEREHVDDDSIGANLIPEPEFSFNLISMDDQVIDLSDMWVVVETAQYPHHVAGIGWWGSDAEEGSIYNNVFNGSSYYVFEPDAADTGSDSDHAGSAKQLLKVLNQVGAADAVTNVFMFPKDYLTPQAEWREDRRLPDIETPGVRNLEYTSRPSSLDGYIPRNNKLFTYPYCYCNISDNNGNAADIKYELWQDSQQGYILQMQSAIAPDASMFVYPVNYAGELAPMDNGISFPCTVSCSWIYSAYQQWVAQNALANALTIATNVAAIAIPAARGLGAAAKTLGSTVRAKGGIGAVRNMQGGTGTALLGRESRRAGIETATSGWGGLSMGVGAMGLANFAGEAYRQSMVPNVTRGNASANSIFANGLLSLHIKQMTMQAQFAERMDGFFDMYGYQVDAVKVPNRTGRPNWNYVKCQNSANHGNVPADQMALINSIYDNGITFWHTPDVGNYSLPNK